MTAINPTAIAVLAQADHVRHVVRAFEDGHATTTQVHDALVAFHRGIYEAGGAVITANAIAAIVDEHLDRCRATIPSEVQP